MSEKQAITLPVLYEPSEDGTEIVAVVEPKRGDLVLWTVGDNQEQVTHYLREIIQDYQAHEGQQDPAWNTVDAEKIQFEFKPRADVSST